MAVADAAGRAYHVAPAGADTASGTAARPLRTIGACLSRVRPGDTCLVHRGTYREQVTPPSTKDAPVTIAAYGDGPVTVDGTEPVTGWRDAGGGWSPPTPSFRPTLSNIIGSMPISVSQTGDPLPVVRSNLISGRPGYTDAVNGELWLKPDSPAIDAGETVDGVTTDVRGAAPDQGAYEYGEPIWSTGCNLPGCQQRVRHGTWTATASDGIDASAVTDGDIDTR